MRFICIYTDEAGEMLKCICSKEALLALAAQKLVSVDRPRIGPWVEQAKVGQAWAPELDYFIVVRLCDTPEE